MGWGERAWGFDDVKEDVYFAYSLGLDVCI